MEENTIRKNCKIIIIGGSAGSLEVLLQIIPKLTNIKPFALVLVLHRKSSEDNTLEELMALKTTLPVKPVEDKTPLIPGSIYIAPADYHLLFEKDCTFALDISEKIHYSRPSIDVAFESAAEVFGKTLVAILLSGANADGTQGLKAVKNYGGVTIVQNPVTAEMPFMPQSAIDSGLADKILDINQITTYIQALP
jgi:two-component system, chemotaxis family, protein-glutamate methylesterase/glutaminase